MPILSKGKVFLSIIIYAKFFCTPSICKHKRVWSFKFGKFPFQRENILKTDFVFSFLQINRLLMKIAVHSEKNENSNNF